MSDERPNIDVFPIGVVEHTGRNYWIWKIGWMLTALFGTLALGSAVLFLAPSVAKLVGDNQFLITRVAAARDIAEETREDLAEAREENTKNALISEEAVARQECRNKYDLAITEALIKNTIAQNNFVTSLAGVDHGATIADQGAALDASNDILNEAVAARNSYEEGGATLPCPI